MIYKADTIFKTYRDVLILYIIIFICLFSPFIIFGEVIAPHRQNIELGLTDISSKIQFIENYKFNDYSNAYIPEISEALSGPRSGWLTLWTAKTELGRPLYQISGFTPAYLPSWILSKFIINPWVFITTLSMLGCFFAGFFLILFFRETGCLPFAALIGGVSMITSSLFMYWLTFPMFHATWCWVAGSMWALTRIAKKGDLLGWVVLSFSIYSLGMTAYPQLIVYNAYILLGYGFYLARIQLRSGWKNLSEFIFLSISAVTLGGLLVLPVYLDLADIAANSSRVSLPSSFYSMYLPTIASFDEWLRFFVLTLFPEIFGNQIKSTYPFQYDGLSITPILLFLSLVGLFCAFKKTWGWWLAVLIYFSLTISKDLYEFAAQYLGFNLSPSIPTGTVILPLAIISAVGFHEFLKQGDKAKKKIIIFPVLIVSLVIITSVLWAINQGLVLQWNVIYLTILILILFSIQIYKIFPWLIILALVIGFAIYSYPLMLRQPFDNILKTSLLVDSVKNELKKNGGRFAIVDSDLRILPPNLNATVGLTSIHSYNSLSSLKYQKLINELGGDARFLGRWNASISPDYNSNIFWLSNITLILSSQRLFEKNLDYLYEIAGVHLHGVRSSIGDGVQVLRSSVDIVKDFDLDELHDGSIYHPIKKIDLGDLIEFDLKSLSSPSLMILSQKFHRNWQAEVLTDSGRYLAETYAVNGVFQGIKLPPDALSIRLVFKPYARYAWIGHIFWLLMLMLIVYRLWQRRHLISNK